MIRYLRQVPTSKHPSMIQSHQTGLKTSLREVGFYIYKYVYIQTNTHTYSLIPLIIIHSFVNAKFTVEILELQTPMVRNSDTCGIIAVFLLPL